MKEKMKDLVISHGNDVLYDANECRVGQRIYQKDSQELKGKTLKAFAEEKKKEFYSVFFKRRFSHIVFLSAAGTSLDNGTKPGRTRAELWKDCKAEIDAFKEEIPGIITKDFYKSQDIESFLSYLLLYSKVNVTKDSFKKKIKVLKKRIVDLCVLELQAEAPHRRFLNIITARKPSDSRIQVFTTNYDTLFEQAANDSGFTIVDGFSYTQPRVFSGRYFDYDFVNRERSRLKNEESFVTKVFHLYKLHGSLTWEKDKKGRIIQTPKPKDPLIIYPASDKYESSYEQPYFEMMSRFQNSLRRENVLLIVVGFGFKDKHIQSAILEAVDQNPNFQLVVIDYNNNGSINKSNLKMLFDNGYENVKSNVTIIFDSFSGFVENLPKNETYLEDDKSDEII